MKKKIALALAFILLIVLLFWMKGCEDVDRCLDRGGRWDYNENICVSKTRNE